VNSRPEYVGILLGLSKIGVTAALINTNLTYRCRHLEFLFRTDKEIRRYGGKGRSVEGWWLNIEGLVAKLEELSLAIAAPWVRIQTSLKNYK
jgi:hypothetical protein